MRTFGTIFSLTRKAALVLLATALGSMVPAGEATGPLRIMPLGDSITRGSYFARYQHGPYADQAIGLANPEAGGWRKPLQDQLRAVGLAYNFVGALSYYAYGHDGVVDPDFDPDHHGLAGFSNRQILTGGRVPTPRDILDTLGVAEIIVPDLLTVLQKEKPDVILLMSGANGFDASARDELIRFIGDHSTAHLFVATTTPQRPPRKDWEQVGAYNASLPAIVATQQAAGHAITLVNMHDALRSADLLPDGVHPNRSGLNKMASAWFQALRDTGYLSAIHAVED